MEVRGAGRALFAAILLVIAGTLNIIYGIVGVSNGNYLEAETYLFSNVDTWGWILVILGLIQLTAGFSLISGGLYGRTIGIFAASLGAVGALVGVGGAHPFWSLGVFALCVIIIHGLVVYGEPVDRVDRTPAP